MRIRDLFLGLLAMGATYTVGGIWTLQASTPNDIDTSTGPNDYRWFAGVHNFFGQSWLVRVSDTADANNATSHHRMLVSKDGGLTYPINYRIPGIHTSREPICMVTGSDALAGNIIAPAAFPRPTIPPVGLLAGGSYVIAVQGGLRSLKADYVQIRGGGLDYTCTYGGVSITGFTRDITAGFWYGDIVQLSSNNWVSGIQIQYVGDGTYTDECIKSTDQGRTWAKIGTIATTAVGGEGFSEPCMIRLPSTSELMVVSRVGTNGGTTKLGRTFSSDNGVTWGAVDRIPPYGKAASPFQLANGDFVICTGGFTNNATDTAITGLGLWLETDPHGTWSTAPWDLLLHHNSQIADPTQQFFTGAPPGGTRGYTGIAEISKLSNGSAIRICYERSAGADGLDANPNRIYTVDVTITR